MSLYDPPIIATGGDTVQDINGNRIHTFTTVGTTSFVVTRGGPVEVLVVAGGGSGGVRHGGGGGAGGLVYNRSFIVSTSSITVTVGDGGAARLGSAGAGAGNSGSNSVFGSLTAIGGGYGNPGTGGAGGSGGGGWYTGVLGGTGTPGQGNQGGMGSQGPFINENTYAGGGGGGAGNAGGNSTSIAPVIAGSGGNGLQYSISGTPTYYAGGGGGSTTTSTGSGATGGSGGLGGGGAGSGLVNNPSDGVSGTNGTGGGGGAGGWTGSTNFNSGKGGSGIVIVRYPLGTIFTGSAIAAPRGIFTSTPNGLTSAQAATNALALKQGYPGYGDGVYWINCGGVPKQTYCLMASKWDGGGWMLIMKAAQGSTFNWGSTHWTTTSTLNPTDTTTTVADAKFDVFNSVPVTDVMAVWPASDIGAGNTGGSLSVSDGWVWLVKNWYTGAITPLAGFQIDRDATPADIFSFSGFSTSSPIWSYQTGTRAHVFGSGAHIAGPDTYITRWGFLWNNEPGTTNTQDAFAGIGLNSPSSSGGDFWFWEYVDKKGFNRNIAWLMYGR